MKKYCIILAALLLFGMGACASNPGVDNAHNSRNSLDWDGVYSGVTPAADCPGIDVQLTLNSNETYELIYSYIDRDGGPYTEKGKFTWDKAGEIITLDVKDYPPHFKVGQNRLFQLDMDGEIITGILAENYVLTKTQ